MILSVARDASGLREYMYLRIAIKYGLYCDTGTTCISSVQLRQGTGDEALRCEGAVDLLSDGDTSVAGLPRQYRDLPARHMRSSSEALAHAFLAASMQCRAALSSFQSALTQRSDSANQKTFSQLLAGTVSGPGRSPGIARVPNLRVRPAGAATSSNFDVTPREATLGGQGREQDRGGSRGGDKEGVVG